MNRKQRKEWLLKHFRSEAEMIYSHYAPEDRERLAQHMAKTHVGIHGKGEPPHRLPLWLWIVGLLLALTLICVVFKAHAEPEPDFLSVVRHDFGLPQETVPVSLFKFDGSGNLSVNCLLGCSAPASFVDNTLYTVGTSTISVIGGLYSTVDPACTLLNACRLRVDASSNLRVNCITGCSASSFLDNAGFTAGTTPVNITGGWYSTSPTNCTSGSSCAPQLTIDRKLFVQAFQGTSPWVVSANGGSFAVTGTFFQATQPVSCATAATCPVNASQVGGPWTQNLTQVAGTALGATAIVNYGSTPAAVAVPAVNAFITNTIPVTGTFFQTTQPVSCTAANCSINLAQEAGTAITNTPTAIGTKGAGNVMSVNSDTTSIAGTATVVAAAGVQKVGIVGNAGAIFDAANNTAMPANEVAIGAFAQATQANPAVGTSTDIIRPAADVTGNIFVVEGGPNRFTCTQHALVATLTQCQAAPAASFRNYVTDITVDTTTATAGTYAIQYGTGTNCVTGTTALYPSDATTSRWTAPVLGAPEIISFRTPLVPATANAICVIGTATNTINIQLNGYIAP